MLTRASANLTRLAECLLPLFSDDQDEAVAIAVASLGTFRPLYGAARSAGMSAKLGLSEQVSDDLTGDLLGLLEQSTFFQDMYVLPGIGTRGTR